METADRAFLHVLRSGMARRSEHLVGLSREAPWGEKRGGFPEEGGGVQGNNGEGTCKITNEQQRTGRAGMGGRS